jgi:tetratricopeptide (TPR) repeat protein
MRRLPGGARLGTLSGLGAILVFALSLACSPAFKRADALFQAGDLAEAAPAYEEALATGPTGAASARSLYRLGTSRATPGSGAFDPAKARRAFDLLVKTYPGSDYAVRASLILALLAQLDAADARYQDLAKELNRAKERLAATGSESADLKAELDGQRAAAAQLKGKAAEQAVLIARLQHELEMLKRIDLAPRR